MPCFLPAAIPAARAECGRKSADIPAAVIILPISVANDDDSETLLTEVKVVPETTYLGKSSLGDGIAHIDLGDCSCLFVFIILYVSSAFLPPPLGDLLGSACLIQMDHRHSGVQDSAGLPASTMRVPDCMHSCRQAARRPPLQRKFGFFLAKTLKLRRGFGFCASV